jgi:exopolysaccharide biosynthesis polyprenyl glycosylphosphotransferase
MNATQRDALLRGLEIHSEVAAVIDERTLEILDRRRRTAVVRRRGWLVKRMLLAADLIGLMAAMLLAEWVVNRHNSMGVLNMHAEIVVFVVTLPAWVVVAKLYGLYDHDEERADHSTTDDFSSVFQMVTVCTWLFWIAAYLTGLAHPTTAKLLIFWAAAIAFITLGRATARAIARRNAMYFQNAVIVGAGDVGQLIAKKLLQHPEYGINLVGFIDAQPKERRDDLEQLALLGGPERLPAIVRLFDIERVVLAFSNESHEDTLALVHSLKDFNVQIDIVPRLFETVGPNANVHMIEGLPLVGLPSLKLARSSAFLKRAMDISLAALGLLVLSPVLIAIAVAVKLDSRGPVLYRHQRVGRGRVAIHVLKFRTMRLEACRGERYGGEEAEAAFRDLISDPQRAQEFEASYKFAADPRVTRVGRFLRRTSLDELPQLLNVLSGDISLVGPRAITLDELGRYGTRVDDLLGVRPGVTGYWQINGRSRLSYDDRVRLDLSYITGWSLRLDLAILAKTFRVLATRGEAY